MADLEIKPSILSGRPPVVIARMAGKLNEHTAGLFKKFAAEVIKRKIKRVVFDLPDLKYMGSTGFDAAVQFGEKLTAAGGTCAVARASPKIRVVFETLGLQSVFQLYPDLEGALRALRPGSSADSEIRRATHATPARPVTAVPDSLPTFEEAVGHFRRALADRSLPKEFSWIFREDLHAGRDRMSLKLPLPKANEARVKAIYEEGRHAGADVEFRVFCLLEGKACACVLIGAGGDGLTFEVPPDVREAQAVGGGFGWWVRRFLDGKAAEGALAELPARGG